MSYKLSSTPILTRHQLFTQSTAMFNASDENVIIAKQSKIQRWIFGMIIGSAPFLVILICWMFVSLCINNLVRFYQYKKGRYRHNIRTDGIRRISSKINI